MRLGIGFAAVAAFVLTAAVPTEAFLIGYRF
jgi:hypothetical protein